MNRCLAVFCKPPIPGKAKTRLASQVGREAAHAIYSLLLSQAAAIFARAPGETCVYLSEPAGKYPPPWSSYELQWGNDLGERMKNAFIHSFENGFSRTLLCGSDIPCLTAEIVSNLFSQLETHDTVIGPARDGGYYAIGFSRESFREELFSDIPWSTNRVLSCTRAAAEKLGLRYFTGPRLNDLDTAEDAMRIVESESGAFADELRLLLANSRLRARRGDPRSQ